MLTPDMKRVIDEQKLAFVATVGADMTPNLSPKATFAILDERTIAFLELRSPATLRNLSENPGVEINFVDPFVRKGYRFKGRARVAKRGSDEFAKLIGRFERYGELRDRAGAIVVVDIAKALPVTSPAYDRGANEADIRNSWTAHFRAIQPGGRYSHESGA